MNVLRKIFILPEYKDETEAQHAYLLHIIAWVLAAIPIPFAIYTAVMESENLVRVLIQFATGEVFSVILFILLHRKYVRIASVLLVGFSWLFFTILAISGTGVNSEAYLLGYALVISVAGIFLGGIGSIIVACLSLLAGIHMVYTQTQGISPQSANQNPLTTWMISAVLFPVGAMLQYLASRTLRNALNRARDSEEKYRLISQVSSDYTFSTEVDFNGNLHPNWVAGAFEKMTGYTYEEYVAAGGWLAQVHPDDLKKDAQDMESLCKNKDVQSEIRTFTKNGETRWNQVFAHPIWNEKENRLTGIVGAVRDITEQKRIEADLSDQRDFLQNFMDNVPDTVWFKDTESRFIRINKAQARLLNIDNSQDAIGKTDLDFQDPKLAQEFMTEEKQILETHKPVLNRIEYNPTRDGKPRWLTTTKVPVKDKSGRVIGIIGVSRDVTEHKHIESMLAYERDLLQMFMDNIPDPVYFKDTESHFQRINQAHARFLGVASPHDAVGKTDLDFQNPELAREFLLEERKIVETGQPIIDRLEFNTTKDGEPVWFSATKVPVKNESGQIIGIVGISRNVTEQKRIEAMLANERDILQIFMDNIPDNIYFKDTESRFIRINQGQARFLGIEKPEDAIGKTDFDFQDEEFSKVFFEEEKRIMETGEPVWNRIEVNRTKDGPITWFSTSKVPARNEAGQIIGTIGISRNITEQKKIEELEQQRRVMLENVIKLGKSVTELNDLDTTLEKIWHGIHDDLQFDRVGIFLYNPEIDSLDRALGTDNFDNMVNEPGASFPVKGQSKIVQILNVPDGFYFTRDYTAETDIPEDHEMYGVKDHATLAVWMGDKPIAVICVDRLPSGLPITPLQLEALRLFGGYIGFAIENARLNSALENELELRKEIIDELEAKNAELERFTYTVSHDLKSPLVTIRGFLGYLERDALKGNFQQLTHDKLRIESAVEKMQNLLNDLLELSRIGRLVNPSVEIPFNDLVRDTLEILHGQLEAGHVHVEYMDNDVIVKCDRLRITEVLQNLIDNAIKFMGDQPDPQITIGVKTNENNETVFFVRDNGMGIEKQYHEHIFSLFNKLNADTEGTGIGLTLIKRIIEMHNGRIWLESEPGKGTTFYFTIPTSKN